VGLLSHQESFAKQRPSTFSMFIQNLSITRDRRFSLYPSFSLITDIFRLEFLLEPNLIRNSFSVLRCWSIPSGFDGLAIDHSMLYRRSLSGDDPSKISPEKQRTVQAGGDK
jgi:hypothetical protein